MKLSEEQIQSFIECWREDFGETLTRELATIEATRLLDFFAAMADLLHRHQPALRPDQEAIQ